MHQLRGGHMGFGSKPILRATLMFMRTHVPTTPGAKRRGEKHKLSSFI